MLQVSRPRTPVAIAERLQQEPGRHVCGTEESLGYVFAGISPLLFMILSTYILHISTYIYIHTYTCTYIFLDKYMYRERFICLLKGLHCMYQVDSGLGTSEVQTQSQVSPGLRWSGPSPKLWILLVSSVQTAKSISEKERVHGCAAYV